MKGLLLCCLIVSASALAGCASHSDMYAAAPASASISQPAAFRTDGEYVLRVEQIARRRGVGVHWVNPPLRRSDPVAANLPPE